MGLATGAPTPPVNAGAANDEARATGPGFVNRASPATRPEAVVEGGVVAQAAGLKIFDALDLIGSAVSVAIFWVSSPSSLAWAVRV